MAAQGDKSAAANLRRLQEMERTLKDDHEINKQDKMLQAVQTYEAVQADKDDDRIAESTEKTADTVSEVNENIIKLANAIKKSTRGEVVDNDPVQGSPTTAADRVKQATQEVDTSRVNVKGPVERFKELGTLKGFFDTSGPSRGMLDDIIRRRIEKTEYIKTQQEVGGSTKEEASKRFEQIDKLKKEAGGFKSQIEGYKKQGVSDEQLERTDAYKNLKEVESKIIAADPLLRERVSPKEQPPQAAVAVNNNQRTSNVRTNTLNTMVAAAGATPASFQAPLSASREATTSLLGGAEEQQIEQTRLFQQEIDVLNRIEENTRSLKDVEKPKQTSEAAPKPSTGPSIGLPSRVPGAGMLGRTLQAAARFVFSAAGLKLLVGAGLFLSLKKLSEDFQEGKARSEEYKDLRTEREAGTITPEGQAKLDELERRKQSGEATVFSGSQSEEVGRTLKSRIDKETAEDVLKGLDSTNPEDKSRAEQTLKEFGVSKQVLQRYYDRVYGPEATAKTRKGATLGSVSVEMGELQRTIPAQQEIARGDAARAAAAGAAGVPGAPGAAAKPFVIGQGDASDIITGEDGQKIEYKYSSGQPYTWTAEEIKEKVKILQKGGKVDFGTDFIPKDEKHRNPIIRNKEISAAAPDVAPKTDQVSPAATPQAAAPTTAEPAPTSTVPPVLTPLEMAKLSPVERSRIRREQNLQARAAAKAAKTTTPTEAVTPVAPTVATPTEAVTPVAPTPVVGEVIYNQSESNAAAATVAPPPPAAPVVINAPTNVQQTSNYGAKSPPRNPESSYQQYNRSKY